MKKSTAETKHQNPQVISGKGCSERICLEACVVVRPLQHAPQQHHLCLPCRLPGAEAEVAAEAALEVEAEESERRKRGRLIA